ncbi:uncharacterized protein LOC116136849 [Pistacia vera]|uniref:uncharacterized protein LOC116136849 n=1 Tax=Pistacia vera TaxID=55513 RepID=UPI00126311FB|nr:uncharacterized protein LOC116136849 [Pistacia vera]
MVRKKDKIREHVEELQGNKWKCKFCQKVFSSGAYRIKAHLSGITGHDVEICSEVNHETQACAFLAMSGSGSNKKLKSSAGSSTALNSNDHEEETDSPFSPLSKGSQRRQSQASLLLMNKKKDKEFVDKMFAKCFVVNNIAFNVVQTSAFGEFVKAVAEYGATYKLPSYSTLRTQLIPESRKGVDDAVFIKSLDVSREIKTGIYLKEIVASVIESIGQEHVVQFITNNGSNFTSAGDILIGLYPRMYKTNEARIIVMFMTRYTVLHAAMKEYTKDRQLRQPCATRFASNFLMLQSVLDLGNELRLFVASSEWRSFDYCKTESSKRVTEIVQSDFWTRGKEVIKTIEPLVRVRVQVLHLVDGDGSTAGYLYEAMMRAKVAIKERCNSEASKYGRIWELFENRWVKNIIHPIHVVVAFLNPSYFFSQNFRGDRETKDDINFIYENLLLIEEKHPFMREVQLYCSRPATLFTATAKTMLQTSHPRIWWDYNGDDLPMLKKYAIRILSQPCSASSCERNWSAFEAAQKKKRNRLSHEMLDTLVYVRMNTMMMDKFTSTMSHDLEPIDLEKLGKLPDYEYEEIHMDEDANSTPTVEGYMDDLMDNDDIAGAFF